MDIFGLHGKILGDYESYIRSFVNIKDKRIQEKVEDELKKGLLWPEPLVQFNPLFKTGKSIDDLCASHDVHDDLAEIFKGFELYQHQVEAIDLGVKDKDFIVTSGTESGKSLTYIGTIFNHVLKNKGTSTGIKALIVYPMNALINSQSEEFGKFKTKYEEHHGEDTFPVSFAQYTGQESSETKELIKKNPPDILLTNYMMLELMMTRSGEKSIRDSTQSHLKYLVFDELHTYRRRQGSDVSMLIRRIKAHANNPVSCIGTSATMVSGDSLMEQKVAVAEVGTTIFGAPFKPEQIVFESLERQIAKSRTEVSDEQLATSLQYPLPGNTDEEDLKVHPLSVWLESEVALEEIYGWLRRRKPLAIGQICAKFSDATGIDLGTCELRMREMLNWSKTLNAFLKSNDHDKSDIDFNLLITSSL